MCYICIAKFQEKHAKDKKFAKFGTIVVTPVSIEVLHIAYVALSGGSYYGFINSS